MRKALILVLIFLTFSCKKVNSNEKTVINDNPTLKAIYKADQNERKSDNIDFGKLYVNDSLRRIRVTHLLESGKVRTGKDFARAAMIFQHGNDSVDFGKALKFIKIAIEKDTTIHKSLFAAATDRYLLSMGEPQIYGTQYTRVGDGPWKLDHIDTTKITDTERKKYGVKTLAEQKLYVNEMNLNKD